MKKKSSVIHVAEIKAIGRNIDIDFVCSKLSFYIIDLSKFMRHSNEFFSSPEMKAVDKLFIF
jgi:hypothetical protein